MHYLCLKKEPSYCAFNYKPISFTSIISKVVKRMIVNQLRKYLAEHNVLKSYLTPYVFSFKNSFTIIIIIIGINFT